MVEGSECSCAQASAVAHSNTASAKARAIHFIPCPRRLRSADMIADGPHAVQGISLVHSWRSGLRHATAAVQMARMAPGSQFRPRGAVGECRVAVSDFSWVKSGARRHTRPKRARYRVARACACACAETLPCPALAGDAPPAIARVRRGAACTAAPPSGAVRAGGGPLPYSADGRAASAMRSRSSAKRSKQHASASAEIDS